MSYFIAKCKQFPFVIVLMKFFLLYLDIKVSKTLIKKALVSQGAGFSREQFLLLFIRHMPTCNKYASLKTTEDE